MELEWFLALSTQWGYLTLTVPPLEGGVDSFHFIVRFQTLHSSWAIDMLSGVGDPVRSVGEGNRGIALLLVRRKVNASLQTNADKQTRESYLGSRTLSIGCAELPPIDVYRTEEGASLAKVLAKG